MRVTNFLNSVGIIKRKSQFEKWNSQKFLAEAGETYKDMNDAFARYVYLIPFLCILNSLLYLYNYF